MKIVVADWETYFDNSYTLSKLTTEQYVRSDGTNVRLPDGTFAPAFEPHGCAIKWTPDVPAVWYCRPDIDRIMESHNWSDTMLIHHHAQFDSLIEAYWYGVSPKAIGCTLSMARLLLGNHVSVSLDSVRKRFGIPPKTTPYNLFRGKHWEQLTRWEQDQVAGGACDEVESIWKIFQILAKDFPTEEYQVVDTIIRMFTEPVLRADLNLLREIWKDEAIAKEGRLEILSREFARPIGKEQLQSAEQFATLLRECGVEPGTKPSPTGNGDIYAFARTDQFMRDLQDDEDDVIRMLAEARIGQKSTLLQTRAETYAGMERRGSLAVYLSYSGASTLRVSGGDRGNFLNLKRASKIRKSIKAPEGWMLCPVDSSQIECRVLHYLAGGPDEPVVQKFARGEDCYVDIASQFYGERIYKPKPDDPRREEMEAKRGMGKQSRLMCGYGAAADQFKRTAKNGLYGPSIDISLEDAGRFVALYRSENPSVCARNTGYWAQSERMIARLAGGPPVDWGPLHVRDHRIFLPNGCPLIYDTLEFHRPSADEDCRPFERDGYWRLRTRDGWKKIWGSKLTQNICEAVSRVIISQAMIRIVRLGYRVLNWPYDELLVLIPRDRADEHARTMLAEMRAPVPWLPGLPLDAEAHVGERYEK